MFKSKCVNFIKKLSWENYSVKFLLFNISIILLYRMLTKFAYFMLALNLFSTGWLYIVSFLSFTLPIVVIGVILLHIINRKISCLTKIIGIFLTIGILLFSFIAIPPDYKTTTKGLHLAFKNKSEDISSIRSWLENYDIGNTSEDLKVDESDWPNVINELSPRELYICNRENLYSRLVWGSGALGSYGIVIGANANEIPLNTYYASEYRIIINESSFVWCSLKRAN